MLKPFDSALHIITLRAMSHVSGLNNTSPSGSVLCIVLLNFSAMQIFQSLHAKWLFSLLPVTLAFIIKLGFPGWFCQIDLDVGVSGAFIFSRLFEKTPFVVVSNAKCFEKSN